MRPIDSAAAIVAVAALVQGDTASLDRRVRLYREWIREVERREEPTPVLLGILREALALLEAEIARRVQLTHVEEPQSDESPVVSLVPRKWPVTRYARKARVSLALPHLPRRRVG